MVAEPNKEPLLLSPGDAAPPPDHEAEPPYRKNGRQGDGGGRPKFPVLDHLDTIEKLAGVGLTEAKIAWVIGCHPATLRSNKRIEVEVVRAIERGKARAESVVGTSLFYRAKAGDVAAIRWWEMTRTGRRETADIFVRDVDVSTLTDQELDRLVQGEFTGTIGPSKAKATK